MKKHFKGHANEGGVYKITNLKNEKVYIGSAKCFKIRASQHLTSLRRGKHSNKHLQSAWNLDGSDNFLFEVLEVVEGDKLQRTSKEKQYLDQYLDKWELCYNFQKNPICKQGPWSSTPEKTKEKLSICRKKICSTAQWKQMRKTWTTARIKTELIDPNGKIHNVKNINKFCRDYQLDSSCVYKLIKGQIKHHKNWNLVGNHNKKQKQLCVKVRNIQTKEQIKVSDIPKFCSENSLDLSAFYKVIKGKRIIHKNWKLI